MCVYVCVWGGCVCGWVGVGMYACVFCSCSVGIKCQLSTESFDAHLRENNR